MDYSEKVAQGAVLLTVNQRLARSHHAQFEHWQWQHGNAWWATPDILPLRSWMGALHTQALARGISPLSVLPDLLQQRTWKQCIEQDTALELLDVDAAARDARRAWEVACVWQCFPPEDDYLPRDQYAWQRWSTRYRSLLDKEQWTDTSMLADHLCTLISDGKLNNLLPETIILVGFLQLPPQIETLMSALVAAGTQVSRSIPEPDAVVHSISYADDAQEMLAIATDMRGQIERDPSQSLGLVVPDLQNKRATVLRAFDRVFFPTLSPSKIRQTGRPYDLSIGLPLADTTVVHSALAVLELSVSSLASSELSALLLSPYLEAATSESRRREQMDRRLREERVRSLDLQNFTQQLYSGSKLSNPLKRLLKTRKLAATTSSEWASRYSEWLKAFGWPGKGMESDEYQAVSSWMECLDNLQLLDDGENISAHDALRMVRKLARDQIFQLETPGTPIRIMGRLESHGIAFDCLWLAGLDTEQWPATGSPTPFLPIALQKTGGVPNASATARLALAELEFTQWCSQAPLIIASHALNRDGNELEAAHIPTVSCSEENLKEATARLEPLHADIGVVDPVSIIRSSLSLESVQDSHGPALPEGSDVRGGARLFENQALCPFRAFALHRLHIRPLEEAGLGLDPRQHGTLLHHVLELFWKEIRTHENMIALDSERLQEKILAAIDEAIIANKVPRALCELERVRLQELISEWLLQCEAPRQAFEVVSLEERQEIEHGGIRMKVMLDRIDRVDGSLVVVDYKTGTSNKVSTWADTRIVNPQLPLYVLTNEEIKGVSFAQVARNQCGFKGVASDDAMLPKVNTTVNKSRGGQATTRQLEGWSDWRAHWQESLDAIAAEVQSGLATVTPMKTACLHCELKPLCRIDDGEPLDEGELP